MNRLRTMSGESVIILGTIFIFAISFYLPTIIGCLTASSVLEYTHKWFDYRYFYADEDEYGKCTCGLAREAAAIVIREALPGLMCSDKWSMSLRNFRNNPSVVRFLVEQACLSAISLAGFHHNNINWNTLTATIFKGNLLEAIPSKNCEIFFIPEDPFFQAINAVYLKADAKKKTVLVVPIQVTVAKMHKDSEAAFYSQWSDWEKFFEGYELKTKFVWVVEEEQSWAIKEAEFRTTRDNLNSPAHEQIVVTVGEISSFMGWELEFIRRWRQHNV